MGTKVLLVLRDSDAEDLMRELLDEELKERSASNEPPVYTCVHNEGEAKQHLTSHQYDLLVAQACIPADGKTSPVEVETRGLSVLEFVRTEGLGLPCILLAKMADGRMNTAVERLDRCGLVEEGGLLQKRLNGCLDRILRPVNLKPADEEAQTEIVDVRIVLRKTSKGYYAIQRTGPRFYQTPATELVVDEKRFKDLLDDSTDLELNMEYKRWMDKLRRIGEGLLEELLRNPKFSRDFWAITEAHIERSRFFFDIDEGFHPIALEAIVDHDSKRFWMLEAPVIRRLPYPAVRRPIFTDAQTRNAPINCLIIEAAEVGYAREIDRNFELLSNVAQEAAWLQDFLEAKEQTKPIVPIGRVLRVDEKKVPKGKSFRDHVEQILTASGPWHLVHYGGHSYYRERKGYVIFPGPRGGRVHGQAVDIEEFGQWLRHETRFVYMSSCHSSESDIIFELARNGVPAIVGFRWDVDDERAVEHARSFYTDLLARSKSVEYAFLKARQETYEKYKEDKTWAAPMLILQMLD